jgi:hypothetical protein
MSPSEDAALLLVTVRRQLRSLALTIDHAFPQEDWGFLAQQALENVLRTKAQRETTQRQGSHRPQDIRDTRRVDAISHT